MRRLGRRSAAAATLVLAATTLAGVSASQPASGATTVLACRTQVVGITPTHRVRVTDVLNSKVKRTLSSPTPLNFDPLALAYKSYTHTGAGILGILAIHPDGTPRVLGVRYPSSGTALEVSARRWEHSGFTPTVITGVGGLYYAVNRFGELYKLTEAGTATHMGGNFVRVIAMQYAMTYRENGYVWDVVYVVTRDGLLQQVDIPVSRASTIPSFRTIRSGMGGVTGLAVGFCNNDPFHHAIVEIKGATNQAVWTEIKKAPHPASQNVIQHSAIQPGYNWTLHATF